MNLRHLNCVIFRRALGSVAKFRVVEEVESPGWSLDYETSIVDELEVVELRRDGFAMKGLALLLVSLSNLR